MESNDYQVAVFERSQQPLQIETRSLKELSDGEVLIRIEACTLCGSDLHTISGSRQEKTPTILGHEIVGWVSSLGQSPTKTWSGKELKVGDRVTWSICVSCQHCDRCHAGIPQKCEKLRKIGHERFTQDTSPFGGLSQYIVLPKSSAIFTLPDELPVEIICPANCATATSMSAFAFVDSQSKTNLALKSPETCNSTKSILIIGAGLLGLTASAIAKSLQYQRVVVIDPQIKRQQTAQLFGANETFPSVDELKSALSDVRFDVIMDFSGATAAIDAAIRLANLNGIVLLVGSVLPSPDLNIDPEFLVRNLVTIRGIHNYTPGDLQRAIEFLIQNGSNFPFNQLVEKSFPLERINEAYQFATQFHPVRVMIKP